MPTEELFTAPDPARADGVIRASMPLALSGSLVEGLVLRFEGGQIVEVQADSGADIIRGYIATDPGASRLGEVALVDATSPIRQSGVIFLNTLLDENATCHIAFGDGIRTAVRGFDAANPPSDEEIGVNVSKTHIDFMVGSRDVTVTGVTASGARHTLLRDDLWQI
ncbi:MAG: aminopeptidase [Thermomicrobiales bacterium]